jgi:hypothetical protein
MILVVRPSFQVYEFKHLFNSESHEDWESSTKLIKMNNQASRMFSSLVIFKLSSCDSLPSLTTSRCRYSKVDQMSFTHPNPILLVAMISMSQREDMIKNPF